MRAVHIQRIRGIGGSERHVLTLLPALRQHGVEPLFLGLDDPAGDVAPFYAELAAAGVEAVRLPCPRDLDPLLAVRISSALRRLRPAIVHTHLVHADVYGGLGALASGAALVSTKHNDDRFRLGPFRYVERALARRASRIVAITEALRAFCVEQVGLPAGKVTVVHYGLDSLPRAWGESPELPLPDGARVLLSVARLAPQKGIDVAIRALPAVRAREPRAVLVVLGEGPERPALEALAASLGVADAVFLPGRVGDVTAFYRRADAVVHPARWEGFGLALLEAMLAERPVVATAVSSVPEIVADGETGLLVPPDDPDALARAVSELLADPALTAACGRAGLARARSEFSVARMAERTAALYAAVR